MIQFFCKKESDINSVVQRIVNSIDAILQLAKKNNVKVLVVIPPIPFYGSANVSNIAANYSFSKMKSATFPVYKKLDERISQLEHETVINLMHAFSDDEIYFLDSIGHLTEKGHNKLAEKIIEKAGRFFVINND